jgi:2-hydroxychromene-2-carboxylate isomerase
MVFEKADAGVDNRAPESPKCAGIFRTAAARAMIEFFFDCSSPWTYFAFEGVQKLAAETGAAIDWRPILVGGVFNTVNPTVYANRERPVPAKAAYFAKDLADWSKFLDLPIHVMPTIFPVNSVKAMRGCIRADEKGLLVEFARAAFEAYWRDNLDISNDETLKLLCDGLNIEASWLFEGIATDAIKQKLRANTDELIARGGFGSPTMFVDGGDMYFGNDRLPLLRAAIGRRAR